MKFDNNLYTQFDKKYGTVLTFFVHLQESIFPQILDFISYKIGYGDSYASMDFEENSGFILFSSQANVLEKEEISIVTIEELKMLISPLKEEYLKKFPFKEKQINLLFDGLDDFKKNTTYEEKQKKIGEWVKRTNNQNKLKKSEKSLYQLVLSHTYKNEKIELVYTGYETGYRDSIVEKFKVISNLKKTIVSEFNSSIKHRLNSFSFAHEKWIFIPEVFHYYLYDIENEEIFNQTVWFRENKHNYQDSNIGNYFTGNNHFSINRKSFVVFDLIKEEKQIIKPKDLLGEISWAYMLDSMTIRFFFNSENRTALFNITDGTFYSIKPIVAGKEKIKLIHTKKYTKNEGNHITNFKVVIDDIANEHFQFTEKIKQSS
jgi:hypothetical protein